MTFQARLKKVCKAGNLTIADLARWLDRPDPTVRAWVERGIEPGGAPLDVEHAYEMLGLLEQLVERRLGFPVPRLGPKERIAHVRQVREKVMR